jgi:misacylated tRNA(Ala) deacylase
VGRTLFTEKLYLDNIESAYYTTFDAKVIGIVEQKIILDRTLFYPIGGGQNWDTGTLLGPNGIQNVTEVRGRDAVEHYIEADHQLEVGDEVRGSIDWGRRHAHMRMHTAQHVVSGVAYELFDGARTVGNQINIETSRIDFKPISFDEEKLDALSSTSNSFLNNEIEVVSQTMTRAEINAQMPAERTNMDLVPSHVEELRIIKIGDMIDMCPCAGTHVRNLSEIGNMNIIGKKSKGKGTQRITYELESLETVQPLTNVI